SPQIYRLTATGCRGLSFSQAERFVRRLDQLLDGAIHLAPKAFDCKINETSTLGGPLALLARCATSLEITADHHRSLDDGSTGTMRSLSVERARQATFAMALPLRCAASL